MVLWVKRTLSDSQEVNMKIINEKGKLFGIINVVDLIAILVIVAVVAGVIWKIGFNKISDAIAADMEITYTVKVEQVDVELYERIKETVPSTIMTNGTYVDGEFTDVELLGYVTEGKDEYGNVVYYEDETMCDLLFTAKAKVPHGSVNLPVGSQEVRLGKEHIVKTRYFEVTGIVMSLDVPQ